MGLLKEEQLGSRKLGLDPAGTGSNTLPESGVSALQWGLSGGQDGCKGQITWR
jgi:hypothetical protein